MTNNNPHKTDTPITDFGSPLREHTAGKTVRCRNEACTVYLKTFYRIVLVKRFYEHETQQWTCKICNSKHTTEYGIY